MNMVMSGMKSPIMPGRAMPADITLVTGSGRNTKDLDWERISSGKQALYQYL